jgi:hypothetical protein
MITLAGNGELWDVAFIRRPDGDAEAVQAFLDAPEWIKGEIRQTLDWIACEYENPRSASPLCMVCGRAAFSHFSPAVFVVARPSMAECDGLAAPICNRCATDPEIEGRALERVKRESGYAEVAWGKA